MKLKILALLTIILIASNSLFAASYFYMNSKKTDASSLATVANPPTFAFESKSQVLMEPNSGTVIYANNENERILPASVTKVMTLILAMEAIDSGKLKYDDKITCSANASKMGGSQIWFKENEQLTVNDALKAICVVSANDVTVAIAEHLAGSEANFVKQMNEKAKTLGMNNTNFENCHGIDSDNHYTTAMDIALMSRELITKHPDILKYTSIWMDTLRDGAFGLTNTNKLIRFYEGATGLKTGSTSKAKFNLSGCATRNNTTFLAVVCTAPTSDIRSNEIKQLLDYGFANFESKVIKEKDTVMETKMINKSMKQLVDMITKMPVSILNEKGKVTEVVENITYTEELLAPLNKGDVVGKVTFTQKGSNDKLGECDLILSQSVERSTLKDYFLKQLCIFE